MDNATKCVNISIVDDNALEGNQTFMVTLTTSDPDVMLGNNMTAINIVDNDGIIFYVIIIHLYFIKNTSVDVTVSLPAMLRVNEGDGMVRVCVALSAMEDTERNFTIAIATNDGTGI